MTLAYLASPYQHDDPGVEHKRYEQVCLTVGDLLRAGYHVLSPIAHTHPVAVRCGFGGDFAWWADYDFALIDHCDEVWVLMLEGWRQSKEIRSQVAYARKAGKPIKWVFSETLEVVGHDPDEVTREDPIR